jgi:RimJ/RimL family protein N-acetyltransferase
VLVRLRQEVQALSRRVIAPPAPILGASISLEPLTAGAADVLDRLAREDDVRRFTRVPAEPRDGFGAEWAARYVQGWRDGASAAFLIRDSDGDLVGFAAFVRLDRDAREGEIGYIVDAAVRGRGIASEALALLTAWGFAELGLERIELRIEVENPASQRVAERCGYTHEGTLRSVHLKDGVRVDTTVWSRLRTD